MASTYTPNTNIELQGTGDNPGTWGGVLNTTALTIIDQVFGGVQTISLSNIPVAVSTSQSQNNCIKFTGTLTGHVTVTFPAIGRTYYIQNNTTGAYNVTIACAGGGSTYVLPQSQATMVVLDGTNAFNALDSASATEGTISGITLSTSTIDLKQGTDPTPTTSGDIQYSTLFKHLKVGDGSGTGRFLPGPAPGAIYGATLANNASDATNDIDFAAGQVADSTNALYLINSALTKRLDAAWAVGTNQGGLFSGAIANTTYHCFIIMRPDTGVVDAGFDTSLTAANRPVAYTYYRRVGSIVRTGGSIKAFHQIGDTFYWDVMALDDSTTTVGPSTLTLTVPTGIVVQAMFNVSIEDNTTVTGAYGVIVTSLDQPATAPSLSAFTAASQWDNAGPVLGFSGSGIVRTNTSGQVRRELTNTGIAVFRLVTFGWVDGRGQF